MGATEAVARTSFWSAAPCTRPRHSQRSLYRRARACALAPTKFALDFTRQTLGHLDEMEIKCNVSSLFLAFSPRNKLRERAKLTVSEGGAPAGLRPGPRAPLYTIVITLKHDGDTYALDLICKECGGAVSRMHAQAFPRRCFHADTARGISVKTKSTRFDVGSA